MKKLRIGVLMGGKSIEREVSLNSGRTVCDHLDTARYHVVPIFQQSTGELFLLPQRFLHRGKISDFEQRLASEAEALTWDRIAELVDFIYIAMHGRYAEDGTLQGMLEVFGIPYFGSKVFASALGMDKIVQKDFLRAAGIAVPAGVTVEVQDIHAPDMGNLNFPVIVKPHREGSSLGVSVAHNQEELQTAVLRAAHISPGEVQAVMLEEKIVGLEFTCTVITDYKTGTLMPLPITEIVPETEVYEYDQKYMPGRACKYTPARCSQEAAERIQATCIQVMQALGIANIARIDGFLTADNRVVIIDPNTFSGMAPSSFIFTQAAQIGWSHTQLINHLIETELQQYGMLDAILTQEERATAMTEKKIRVAVLLGGASAEREISLESGRNIVYKLSPQKYEAIPVFISSHFKPYIIDQKLLVRNATHEIEAGLDTAQAIFWSDLPKIADFVFIGLHGGLGENGSVQGMLEMLGMPYNGSSVFTSALCMDKFKTNKFLRQRGFHAPAGVLVTRGSLPAGPSSDLGSKPKPDGTAFSPESETKGLCEGWVAYPVIIKPHNDGCSVLVQKAHTSAELQAALEAIFATGREVALVEECLAGTELTVGVIGNTEVQALPPSQAIARGGILSIEEKFLPGAGENQTPALIPVPAIQLVQRTMEAVYKALGCKGYVRIDCFYQTAEESPTGSERVVVLEVNTLPGMTPATCIFHQAAEIGIKPMDFIDKIITLGFEEHAARTVSQQPARAEHVVR